MASVDLGIETLVDNASLPHTAEIVDGVLRLWPDHRKFLGVSLTPRAPRLLQTTETIAGMIMRLASTVPQGLDGLAADYRFLCEQIVYPEELFFRRQGTYRLSRFEDAHNLVYSNAPFMTRYMYGLLVSDALWINHASAMDHLANVFLPMVAPGGHHLEVGPGHGLLMCFAVQAPQIAQFSGWDISETSIAHTGQALAVLGVGRQVNLVAKDLFAPDVLESANASSFDSIVFSEVLEHVENPLQALKILHHLTRPGGLVWVNVPANAPAPDHIYLLRHPDEFAQLLTEAGFEIVTSSVFPQAGLSVERAIRQQLAISCIAIGRKCTS